MKVELLSQKLIKSFWIGEFSNVAELTQLNVPDCREKGCVLALRADISHAELNSILDCLTRVVAEHEIEFHTFDCLQKNLLFILE